MLEELDRVVGEGAALNAQRDAVLERIEEAERDDQAASDLPDRVRQLIGDGLTVQEKKAILIQALRGVAVVVSPDCPTPRFE
jgi:hypothetical protein